MKKIRRWLLLFAVIIALMVRVDGLKATSLIFGRGPATSSTTTTTSTTTAATSTTEESAEVEDEPAEQADDAVTKAPLTGIPQIDYQWDPNLPRELRGANLSNYPFLDSVPAEEDIGFTCDPKLHDGFYASIKYNCQLYHHCIHGMRYDFLCANYTAFDQKTFICHFASEVDCKNSPKYWFRNEPLYKATTTTTLKPPPTTSTTAAPTTVPSRPKPLRKPVRRRRPQVDYYYYDDEYEDDYFEERQRRRKNRPRNRRPVYDDDYEEDDQPARVRPMAPDRYRERERDRVEDEDDYEDRRPYRMKTRNRNSERRPAVAPAAAVEDDRRYYDDRRRDRRPPSDERRRPVVADEEEKRPAVMSERRRPLPGADRERRPSSDRRSVGGNGDDRRSFAADAESRRSSLTEDRKPLKRPLYDERRYQDEEEDDYDVPAKGYAGRRGSAKERQPAANDAVTVKPSGSSIYDRPRAAPKINRPVPLNEKSKYAYGSDGGPGKDGNGGKTSTTAAPAAAEPEYYDEYEDIEEAPARREGAGGGVEKRKASGGDEGEDTVERQRPDYGSGSVRKPPPRPSASSDVVYYDDVIVAKEDLPFRPVPGNVRKPEQTERVNSRDNSELAGANRYTEKGRGSTKHQATAQQLRAFTAPKAPSTAAPVADDVEEDVDDYDVPEVRPAVIARPAANLYANFKNKKQPAQQSQQAAAPQPQTSTDGVSARAPVRSTKRPFLPSRGGNPYLARGLQPVGMAKQSSKSSAGGASEQAEKPAPFRIDLDSSTLSPGAPGGKRNQQTQSSQQHQQQPEVVNVKTLDQLYDDEFDVTLNDALNPTLKPLTRSAPQSFFRNRYVHQPDAEFVPFEPSYAPSEFRRTAVRPPPVLYHTSPAAVAIEASSPQRQRSTKRKHV